MPKTYYHSDFYHTATLEDEKIGIYLPCVGHYDSLHHKVISRTMKDFQVIFIISGSGWVTTAGQTIKLKAGDLFFVFPDIVHTYQCDPITGWDIWWVHFRGDYAERLMAYAGFSINRISDHVGQSPTLLERFNKIYNLYKEKKFHYHIDAAMEFAGLLTCLKTIASHSHMRHPSILDKVDFKLKDIASLAEKAGYSKYHFIRRFTEATGTSPWKYLIAKRIDKSKELLSGTRRSIREISMEVGFDDPDYFTKLFHKKVGVTPLVFRKRTIND